MRDPGEPPRPEELPGHTPDELPVRGPEAPPTPATDAGLDVPDSGPADVATRRCGELGATRYAAGVMQKYGLKRWPECAMNNAASGLYIFRNKNKLAFDPRHNPA
jgi:hypothetical protein